jgi:DNA-binding SARP family transcriptional activator
VYDWPSSRGKAIFKYLVTHRERPVVKEVLMELFWPGAHPDAARNNLNVAIYGLRQALRRTRPSYSHVLFQDDCYLLNPDLRIWVDIEEFTAHCRNAEEMNQRGDQVAATREYHSAETLYEGEFLEEDRYEDWPIPPRQRLRDSFRGALNHLSRFYLDQEDYIASVSVCRKMLAVDPCCEEAHRRLMRCYSRLGQHFLAMRQYHLCVETLAEELDLAPAPSTAQLYHRIRSHDRV